MIFVALIVLLVTVATWFLGMLPAEPAPPDLSGMVESMLASDVVYWVRSLVGTWFPVDVLATALAVLIGWFAALAVFRLVAWVLALIHVAGTEAA